MSGTETNNFDLVIEFSEQAFNDLLFLLLQAPARALCSLIPVPHDEDACDILAVDVSFTLDQLLLARADDDGGVRPRVDYNRLENQLVVAATADQFKEIERIVAEIDQPSTRQRTTDFVPLRFAQAEQVQKALSVFYGPTAFEADTPQKINTRIVADPATSANVSVGAGRSGSVPDGCPVTAPSSATDTLCAVAVGASLTAPTSIDAVAAGPSTVPSFTR